MVNGVDGLKSYQEIEMVIYNIYCNGSLDCDCRPLQIKHDSKSL